MKVEVTEAVKRLDCLLPLVSGLNTLNSNEAALYCRLLDSYVQRGRTLTRDEVAELIGSPDQALARIADRKLIVLDADGNPSGAYPFTSEEREHRVQINGVTVHCMCALDALAVSPMFATPTVIDSQCRVTGDEIHLEQSGTGFSDDTGAAWLGIDWCAASGDIVCADSLCMEMLFLANASVAREWQAGSSANREIFDLQSAVALAAGFFVPLAENCGVAA